MCPRVSLENEPSRCPWVGPPRCPHLPAPAARLPLQGCVHSEASWAGRCRAVAQECAWAAGLPCPQSPDLQPTSEVWKERKTTDSKEAALPLLLGEATSWCSGSPAEGERAASGFRGPWLSCPPLWLNEVPACGNSLEQLTHDWRLGRRGLRACPVSPAYPEVGSAEWPEQVRVCACLTFSRIRVPFMVRKAPVTSVQQLCVENHVLGTCEHRQSQQPQRGDSRQRTCRGGCLSRCSTWSIRLSVSKARELGAVIRPLYG